MTQSDFRQRFWHLVSEIADAVDPAAKTDIQLLELNLTFTAQQGSLTNVEEKARAAHARWEEADEEF